MQHSYARGRTGSKIAAVGAVLALLFSFLAIAPAQAAANVDLTSQLVVPVSAPAASSFEYTATVANIGAQSAANSTFTLQLALGTTKVTASCVEATGAAMCPVSITVADGTSAQGPTVSGTIPSLPSKTNVKFIIKGTFPGATSAEATLSVNPAAGDTDTDPNSNQVTQSTSLNNKASMVVTKSQDLATVASGAQRTYSVGFANTGLVDLNKLSVHDGYSTPGPYSLLYSVACAPSSTAPCPAWADGLDKKLDGTVNTSLFDGAVDIAAGKKLDLIVRMTHTIVGCVANGSIKVNNVAYRDTVAGIDISGSNISPYVDGTVTGLACPKASMVVTKSQDLATVASGAQRTYSVGFANTGLVDLNKLSVHDGYSTPGPYSLLYSVACAPSSTAPCPAWADGLDKKLDGTVNTSLFDGAVDIAAGKKLDLIVRMTHTIVGCVANGSIKVNNVAYRDTVAGIDISGSNISPYVDGTVTGLACPKASMVVTKSQDPVAVASGAQRTYSVGFANTGLVDLNNLPLHDAYSTSGSYSLVYSIKCAPSTTSPCPSWADGIEKTRAASGNISLFDGNADIAAGQMLNLTVNVVSTLDSCPIEGFRRVNNWAYRDNVPGIEILGVSSASVDGTITCSDVATTTEISNDRPQPGEALTASTTIQNSVGLATNFIVTLALPETGFVLDPSNPAFTCTATLAQCPTDLRYDADSHALVGTVASLPAGGSLKLSIDGNAGLIPPKTASYRLTTTAPVGNDVKPASNSSNATFAYTNAQTTVDASISVGLESPADLSFTGTMVCKNQGEFPVSIVVAAGATQAQVSVTEELWMHDDCTTTLTLPAAPEGYSWGDWAAGDSLSVADISAPTVFAFAVPLVKDPLVVVEVPAAASVTDECGVDNAVWNVPEESDQLSWVLADDGVLTVLVKAGFIFADGSFQHSFGMAADSGEACPTVEPSVEPSIDPTTDPTTDPSESVVPTDEPTTEPTDSATPTDDPTTDPTDSATPTDEPTTDPTDSATPTDEPTTGPTVEPSASVDPSESASPSVDPSTDPSTDPSAGPSESGEPSPSVDPSTEPSNTSEPGNTLPTTESSSTATSPGVGMTDGPTENGGQSSTPKSTVTTDSTDSATGEQDQLAHTGAPLMFPVVAAALLLLGAGALIIRRRSGQARH